MKLPGWVVDDRTSVMQEVAPFVHVPPEESWSLVVLAGEMGRAQLQWDPRPEESLAWRDPLPRSSVEALEKLASLYRASRLAKETP